MASPRIIIIGAGMSGLACADALKDAGLTPTLVDKGRGVGGRIATRRAEPGRRFDHGARHLSADGIGFRTVLDKLKEDGVTAHWPDSNNYVGIPGMSAIGKWLARDLDIRLGTEIKGIERANSEWVLHTDQGQMAADLVVMTVPAPQAKALLLPDQEALPDLDDIRMAPTLTLMASFEGMTPSDPSDLDQPGGSLEWVCREASKPGRESGSDWVAHADTEWSMANLERDRESFAQDMLEMLCDRIGIDRGSNTYAVGHRWRYARVVEPLGRPFMALPDRSLFVGGDWCLGPHAEHAWTSGRAMAGEIIKQI